MSDLYGSPTSSRVVHVMGGVSLRDGEEKKIKIAPFVSKQGLYKQFCDERGWIAKRDNGGTYKLDQKEDFVCSWRTFQRFWTREFPNVSVCWAARDVCDQCHIFHY